MDDANEKAEAAGGYTRQSGEIETELSATVSLKTAVYMTTKGDLVVGVVRYVRGERKRGLYVPIGHAAAVARAIDSLVRAHGPGAV